jgi:predicted nucleotidyltransferase
MADKDIIEKIRKSLFVLNANNIKVYKAFLYGSYARNEATEESDIDVLIVSPEFDKRDDRIVGKTWRLVTEIDSRIEPYIVGYDKFISDQDSPLLQIIKKEGIEVKAG